MRLVYFWVVFLPILLRLGSLSQIETTPIGVVFLFDMDKR